MALGLVAACSSTPPPAVAVKRLPLNQIMTASATAPIPSEEINPAVTIPTHYVSRRMESAVPAVVVGAPDDVERVISTQTFSDIAEGVFLIALSMDRAYYPDTRTFGGGTPGAAAEMRKAGLKNVRIRRRDTGGVAVLSITSEEHNGRSNYLGYIAIGDTGSILRVNYVPPVVASPDDARRWENFIGGLGPANRK